MQIWSREMPYTNKSDILPFPHSDYQNQCHHNTNYLVTHRHWLLLIRQSRLDDVFPFLPQPICVPDTKSVLEDLSDFFKGKS